MTETNQNTALPVKKLSKEQKAIIESLPLDYRQHVVFGNEKKAGRDLTQDDLNLLPKVRVAIFKQKIANGSTMPVMDILLDKENTIRVRDFGMGNSGPAKYELMKQDNENNKRFIEIDVKSLNKITEKFGMHDVPCRFFIGEKTDEETGAKSNFMRCQVFLNKPEEGLMTHGAFISYYEMKLILRKDLGYKFVWSTASEEKLVSNDTF